MDNSFSIAERRIGSVREETRTEEQIFFSHYDSIEENNGE
jgi:hypothetical protein